MFLAQTSLHERGPSFAGTQLLPGKLREPEMSAHSCTRSRGV